jgi:hypothetical protein
VIIDAQAIQARIVEFKDDLGRIDLIQVVRKHITTGPSVVLQEATYYDLRDQVARHFKIHPSAVVVVGSCRTGFSIKPTKRYALCAETSDVDLAIVSRDRFDHYWDLVFDYWRARRLWFKPRAWQSFLRELFKGWIWPRWLPPSRHFQEATDWVEFEDQLTRDHFKGRRSVGARLYRSWERLEAYQSVHVIKCKDALLRGRQ